MKTLFGVIFLTLLLTVVTFGQSFQPSEVVKMKSDSVTIYTVVRYSYGGYILSDKDNNQRWVILSDIRSLSSNEADALNGVQYHSSFLFPNTDSLVFGGMKPITIETITPHSSLIFTGVVGVVGGVLGLIASIDNSTSKSPNWVGIISSSIALGSGIGILDFSLERQTFARYSNGMMIRIDFTP